MALRDVTAAVPVLAHLVFYPITDMSATYPSMVTFGEGYLLTLDSMAWYTEKCAPDINHIRASPLLGNLTGMPAAVVVTASLDPIRDQGRVYASTLIAAGVPTVFREARGNIHAFATLRKAVPSSERDLVGALDALKGLIADVLKEQGSES